MLDSVGLSPAGRRVLTLPAWLLAVDAACHVSDDLETSLHGCDMCQL